MAKQTRWVAIATAIALVDGGLWWWLRSVPAVAHRGNRMVAVAPASVPGPHGPEPMAPSAPAATSDSATVPELSAAPTRTPMTMLMALDELFGGQSGQALLLSTDFVERLVNTVDRLGRSQAPTRLWPLVPAPSPFLVDAQGANLVIGIDNGLRYTPYVLLMETVDMHQAVQLYAELYPQFQRAYEARGFAGKSFHERLLATLADLLSAPDLNAPPRVHPSAPDGASADAARSVTLYRFDDPELEAASAGQKTMIRMGAVNARRVKLKLTELLGRLRALGTPP